MSGHRIFEPKNSPCAGPPGLPRALVSPPGSRHPGHAAARKWIFFEHTLFWVDNIISVSYDLKKPSELKKLSKKLPKRVDSIRKLVKTSLFKKGFKSFNKDKKLDERAEIKNLEKLIPDKRQNKWFHPTFYKTDPPPW